MEDSDSDQEVRSRNRDPRKRKRKIPRLDSDQEEVSFDVTEVGKASNSEVPRNTSSTKGYLERNDLLIVYLYCMKKTEAWYFGKAISVSLEDNEGRESLALCP